MKINKEEFETVSKFLHLMKKYDPGGEQWYINCTKEIYQNPDDLGFYRFVRINGNMVMINNETDQP